MKRLAVGLILAIVCVGMVFVAGAQERTGKGKSSSKDLPPEVCKAIEQYIAKINTASAGKDKAVRAAKYAEAQEELAVVLKRRSKEDLLGLASDYARYTELVVAGDAKDANLDELLGKKLNARTELLGMCSSYTTTR